ncbi:hypothetical protein [Streptomyces nigrescens]|uniref:hypothetical protein n=1 Tax=Streptomyces nigrescens TaxID=1920 RepID=UPI00348ACE14
MSSTVTPLAPEARAAYGAYATFPRRRDVADLLTKQLGAMEAYASARRHVPAWNKAATQLKGAIVDVAIATAVRRGRRPLIRAAVAAVKNAIVGFETAYATSLPYDDQGRYSPAPGTEYPFSVSDIGHAAVQLLGPGWEAESVPWGVGASIEHRDETFGYLLLVDTDGDPMPQGDLYVADHSDNGNRTYLPDATPAAPLPSLAARVAATVRELQTRRTDRRSPCPGHSAGAPGPASNRPPRPEPKGLRPPSGRERRKTLPAGPLPGESNAGRPEGTT